MQQRSKNFQFDFLNKTKYKIAKNFFAKSLPIILKHLKKEKNSFVDLTLVGEAEIKKINKKWRKKDASTDVLSFEDKSGVTKDLFPGFLATIIICPKYIESKVGGDKKQFLSYLTWSFVHGILHCSGYDHERFGAAEKRMRLLEQKILKDVSKTKK